MDRLVNYVKYFFYRLFTLNIGENDMRATLIELENGRTGIATADGIVKSYARRRDAVRGAQRLGLVVA